MDSAQSKDEIEFIPVFKDEQRDNGWRKFIVTMTLIIISSIFAGMQLMDMDMWMLFAGSAASVYLGVNVYQKKKLS